MEVWKSLFYVGVYDPKVDVSWPWYFVVEGQYLSSKLRLCSMGRAAVFESGLEARQFFADWKRSGEFRMELIEMRQRVIVPDPAYPAGHPLAILDEIQKGERRTCYAMTARMWMYGTGAGNDLSRATANRHRKVLLKYGIDISRPPSSELVEQLNEARRAQREIVEEAESRRGGRPRLKLVK